MGNKRLDESFFTRNVLEVAPQLIGKIIIRKFSTGEMGRYRITETEAYNGETDLACHASKGLTKRTEVMYHKGGKVYVYLIYGMYWLLNFVTSNEAYPAAVLIRGIEGYSGPGRVGKALQLDQSFYGEVLATSNRIWVEDDGQQFNSSTATRIGVDYADEWAKKPWRYCITIE